MTKLNKGEIHAKEDIMRPSTTTRHENSFADLLRECRKRAGLSQQQLADYLAVSPKRISKWETGVSDPPGDPAFYQRLQTVPGFSEADIALLLEAREVDESARVVSKRRAVIEDDEVVLEDSISALLAEFAQKLLEEKAKAQQKFTEVIERKGIFGKPRKRDVTRAEAEKANRDREILTAQHLAGLGKYAASGQKQVMDVVEFMKTIDDELPDELKPIGQALTQIITSAYAESLTMLSAMGLEGITRERGQVIEDPSATVEVEQRPFHEFFTSSSFNDIISPPMPPEVEPGGHLTEHISDLQSHTKLRPETKQRPSHYPHENVVFHVEQLQAEGLGRQRTKKDSGKSYEVVATLRDAAERTGVADDDILTTNEIESEYHINRKLVHEYTKRGRRGRPHLTPLDVRLARGGGSSQLLFRREDIERIVADPPKTGRPPK